ncbi:MAG: hypothetical protein COB02_02170 [Candidatus Cloacimonadota bacterium]|nr:MAG: hypothetical protein COB02_02170 [Candidatus Cloacimonadota bacterium]
MKSDQFIDPSLLAHVKSLYLTAKTVAEGAIGGFHKSPYLGHNAEFSHHKEYMIGDEIKHIDWKRYAKSGKFYIKQYEESSSLNAMILLDQSASMSVETKTGLNKDQYAKILTSSLAYLLLEQHDGIGFMSFAQNVNSFLPISSKKTRFAELITTLESEQVSGSTSLINAMNQLLPNLKKRSLVIIISDFLHMDNDLLEAIKMLRYFKHEVIAFHLLNNEEIDFPYKDFTLFEDPETKVSMGVDASSVKKLYKKNLDLYLNEVKSSMHKYNVDYQLFQTNQNIEKALIHYLYRRGRHS